MAIIDTNVAIAIRDGDEAIQNWIEDFDDPLMISIVTRVELEGGVFRVPEFATYRRAKLDELIVEVRVLPFGDAEAAAYGRIVARCGYLRCTTLDRMIAATALVRDATLITMNPGDFRSIPGLRLASPS